MSRAARRRQPSSHGDRRNRILAIELTRLREWLASERDRPLDDEVEISGWLLHELESPDATLLTHAICLRMKIARDLASLAACGKESVKERFACQAELMLDSALGIALQRETQQRVDAFIGSGAKEEARRWGGLKSDLFRACARLRDVLTQGDRQRAASFASGLAEELPATLPAAQSKRLDAKPVRRIRRRRNRAVEALALLPTRTEFLIAAAAILAVVWFGFVKAPASTAEEFKRLTLQDFATEPAIVAVEAYPPSLILSVDTVAWQAMAPDQAETLLRNVSFQLTTNGYRGAFIKSDKGRPLAQWLVESGARIFDERAVLAAGASASEPPPEG